MNKRNNLVLFVIFIFLGIVASQPLWGKIVSLPNQNSTLPSDLLGSIDDTTKINIKAPKSDQIVLTKGDSGWQVDQFKASQNKIDALLTDLRNFRLDSLVSTNPENEEKFSVASESGFLVTLTQPKGDTTIIVGGPGSRSSTYFLKPQNTDNVYLADGDLNNLIHQSVNDWRDKTLVDISSDQLDHVVIKYQGQTVTVNKNGEGKWQAIKGKQTTLLGDVVVDRLTKAINPLTGVNIAPADQETDYNRGAKNTITFTTSGENASDHTVTIVKTSSGWLGQGPKSDVIVNLTDDNVKSIMTDLVALFK